MYYEDQIFGCAFGCPLQTRDKDCPFNEVDHLPKKGKVIWLNSLSMEKKESIFGQHLICTKIRQQK